MAEVKFNINPWYAPISETWKNGSPPIFTYNETPVYSNDSGLEVYEMTGLNDDTFALGHYYEVRWVNKNGEKEKRWVFFQDGPIPEEGVTGLTTEALLVIAIHRTSTLNSKFPCEENELAILHMKKALDWFNTRTEKRKARGVEGHLKP